MNSLIHLASIIFSSWAIGAIVTRYLHITNLSAASLSNLRLIKSDELNTYLGVHLFKEIVTKTVYGKINTSLAVNGGNCREVRELRKKMTDAELGHLIGLVSAQLILTLVYVKYTNGVFLLLGIVLNVLLNGYPVLLQQYNKARIDKILGKYCP
ncbi:hypothetical protein [Lewinella sp. IMCC34183]|uniref:glycosyl-4,4'-diaponeurosporenoate acyltransferase CrtO family protein n=1 Tax=Lewinella sp. IMCC34183 TaxID=2248762 RepID=UPI000E254E5D